MIHKFNILLYSFYCFWEDPEINNKIYDFIKRSILGRLVKILNTLIVGILPYWFIRFTWFRIMVYFAENSYKYIPIDLSQLFSDLNIMVRNEGWIRDFYEVYQLDQRIK